MVAVEQFLDLVRGEVLNVESMNSIILALNQATN